VFELVSNIVACKWVIQTRMLEPRLNKCNYQIDTECYCGNQYGIGENHTKQEEDDCKNCKMVPSKKCGGFGRYLLLCLYLFTVLLLKTYFCIVCVCA
jgi:hypothetical protein